MQMGWPRRACSRSASRTALWMARVRSSTLTSLRIVRRLPELLPTALVADLRACATTSGGHQQRGDPTVVVDEPGVRLPPVCVAEVAEAAPVPLSNRRLGNVVAPAADTGPDTADRHLLGPKPEVVQLHN